jgi:hypothetical protein
MEIISLPLLPSPVHFQQHRSLCYVLVFSILFIVQFFFFFFAWGISLPGGYAGLSQGWGEYHVTLGAYLFGLLNVSQTGLESAAGSSGSPPVFSV